MTQNITACGFHAIQTVLDWEPERIIGVWLDKTRRDARMSALHQQLNDHKIAFQLTDKNKLDRLSNSNNHQGVVVELNVATMRNENDLLTAFEQQSKATVATGSGSNSGSTQFWSMPAHCGCSRR